MRSFALSSFLIFLLSGFDKGLVATEVCLTAEEKKLYDLIMEYRKSKKLPPIPLSTKLTLVAQTHARDLADHHEFEPKSKGTDIGAALKFFTNAIKKRSIAFIISDFATMNFEDALKVASKKHDVVAFRISDKREQSLPDMGLVKFVDNETGKTM